MRKIFVLGLIVATVLICNVAGSTDLSESVAMWRNRMNTSLSDLKYYKKNMMIDFFVKLEKLKNDQIKIISSAIDSALDSTRLKIRATKKANYSCYELLKSSLNVTSKNFTRKFDQCIQMELGFMLTVEKKIDNQIAIGLSNLYELSSELKMYCTEVNANDYQSCMEKIKLFEEKKVEDFERTSKNLQNDETSIFNSAENDITKCFEIPLAEFYQSVMTERNIALECILNN